MEELILNNINVNIQISPEAVNYYRKFETEDGDKTVLYLIKDVTYHDGYSGSKGLVVDEQIVELKNRKGFYSFVEIICPKGTYYINKKNVKYIKPDKESKANTMIYFIGLSTGLKIDAPYDFVKKNFI